MIKNIVYFILTILIFSSTTTFANNWWWSKQTETNPQKTTIQKKNTKRPPTTREHIQNLKNTIATSQELDKVVAKNRSKDYRNAMSYADKQRAKIARAERAKKLQRAIEWEKNNSKDTPNNTDKKTTKTPSPSYQTPTNTETKQYIYKPKSKQTYHKKPPRVFNIIE